MMKTSHSDLWRKKKSSLGLKESQLENELKNVSGYFEKKVRNVLIIAAVTGVAIFAVSKIVSKSGKGKDKKQKSGKEEKPDQKVEQKRSFSFKNFLFEKISVFVVGLVLSQLGKAVASKKDEES